MLALTVYGLSARKGMGQRDNIARQPAHRQPPKERLDRTTSSGSKERDFLSNDRHRVEGPKGACASRSAGQGEGEMNSGDDRIPESSESHGLPLPAKAKEKKTAEELAAMIHHDLSQIEGCPQRGVKLTVYGLNPWNCLLTFGVAAGPVQ